MLSLINRLVLNKPKIFLIVFVLFTISILPFSLSIFNNLNAGGYENSSGYHYKALEIEKKYFPEEKPDIVLSFSYDNLNINEPLFNDKLLDFDSYIKKIFPKNVIITYKDISNNLIVSKDNKAVLFAINLPDNYQRDLLINKIDKIIYKYANSKIDIKISGETPITNEINKIVKSDVTKVELITIPIVLLLLIYFFRSIKASLAPIIVAVVSIIYSFFTLSIISNFHSISIFAINIVTGLGMGLGIDYSLLIVNRFKEEMKKNDDSPEIAAYMTLHSAGRTVIFSGMAVALTLLTLLVFPINFLQSLGIAGATVVTFSVIGAIMPLIAILSIYGNKLKGKELIIKDNNFWSTIAKKVINKPLTFFIFTSFSLLALLIPSKDAIFSQADHRILPKDNFILKSVSFFEEQFPDNRDISIIINTKTHNRSDILLLLSEIKSNAILSFERSANGYEKYQLFTNKKSGSVDNISLVEKLLNKDNDIYITGTSAGILDSKRAIFDKLLLLTILVSFLVYIVIFLFTGSVIIPLKAVVMNLLSLAAMIGILTAIFINGALDFMLRDFIKTGYLDLSSLVLAGVVAFGLSMDYEIFLLARIKEEYDRCKDNDQSIIYGITHSAKIITTAAFILAIVFGGFAFTNITSVMMLGLGIAFAITIDATLIRAFLVPATMKLLGNANWWSPKFFKKYTLKH
jgi:RND superfamily putative drug exporter